MRNRLVLPKRVCSFDIETEKEKGQERALSPNPVRLWSAKCASNQRVKGGADMVINQMVGDQV
jgi:hypothetical protein